MPNDSYHTLVPLRKEEVVLFENMNASELRHLQSWMQSAEGAIYLNCNLSNAALRGSRISNAVFKQCTFDEGDMSEAVFSECTFTDCTFIRTNLYKVTFQGCTLEATTAMADSPFVGAGMAHTKFIPSKASSTRTSLSNLYFKQMGFRNGIFSHCEMRRVVFKYVSFEDSILESCTIDSLDLVSCSCRAIRIKDCSIGFFRTNLDKLMSTIGIKDLLSNSDFEVINYGDSGTSQAVTDIHDVFALMRDRMELLVTHGKFFEVFNFIISFASEYGLEQFIPTNQLEQLDLLANLPTDRTSHGTFSPDGAPGRQLYARIARLIPLFMQHSIGISIDSLLYSLRLVTEYNIASPELYKGLMDLAQHLFRTQDREYMDNPTVALVQYYFIELAKRVPTGRVLLRLSHPGIDFSDAERRKEFFDKVDELLGNALPNGNYQFERVVHGSLEQFISTLEYQKIIWFLLIIGIHFKIKYVGGKCEFLFGFDSTRGMNSLTKVLSEGKSILKHLGLKGNKREDTAAAKDVMEQAKKYAGSEYFQKNNVSGDVQRVYLDEYANEDIAGIADLKIENKPLGE